MPDQPDPVQPLAAALADHEAGRIERAEAGYRAVLRDDPDEPDALNLLATLLLERGELDPAIALLTRALLMEPDFPEALSNLAQARRQAGDATAAEALARRAIRRDPELAEAHFNLGRALIDLGNDAGAAVALRQADALAPGQVETLVHLGNAFGRLSDHAAAADTLAAVLTVAPDRVDVMINLGIALTVLGRLEAALHWLDQAAARQPDNAAVHAARATTLRRRQDLAGSIAASRRALELAPERADIWLRLSSNLAAIGQFAEAEACCRRALTLEPDSAAARRELVAIGRHAADAAELPRLRAILDDPTAPRQQRIAAGMAAGALLDKAGAYDDAFAAYAAANRLIRAGWAQLGAPSDNAALHRYADQAIASFTPERFAMTAGWGDPSELPVFIVGMPRSGTSLVEQIAASHKRVFGAGERRDISAIVRGLNRGATHAPPESWDRGAVRHAAAEYVAGLRALDRDAARVIDKMPGNCLLLGQIAILLPRARVIVCRRDPRDACLSCHFQLFADGLAWSTDLGELAERAREIDRLLAHWRAVVKLPILEVRYEELVGDLEAQSRRLIDFLGLEWDPACLDFHTTERAVLTASAWKVRQPLYHSSVGRWRHYQAHLGPLLEGLRGLVPDAPNSDRR